MSTAQSLKQWRERTRHARRAKMKARNQAIADLKKFGYEFDYLRPCPSSFDGKSKGWRKSKTTFHLMTRSVLDMYIFSFGDKTSMRAIQLSTGDFYFLRTYKNK